MILQWFFTESFSMTTTIHWTMQNLIGTMCASKLDIFGSMRPIHYGCQMISYSIYSNTPIPLWNYLRIYHIIHGSSSLKILRRSSTCSIESSSEVFKVEIKLLFIVKIFLFSLFFSHQFNIAFKFKSNTNSAFRNPFSCWTCLLFANG